MITPSQVTAAARVMPCYDVSVAASLAGALVRGATAQRGGYLLASGDHGWRVQPARGAGQPLDRPGDRDRPHDPPALAAKGCGDRCDPGLPLRHAGRPAPPPDLGKPGRGEPGPAQPTVQPFWFFPGQ